MRREMLFIIFVFLVSVFTIHDVDGALLAQYENEPNTGNGLYRFSYRTSDGSSRNEHSEIKTDKDNNEYIIVIGEYRYKDPNGLIHSVTYTADETGYRQNEIIIKRKSNNRISSAALASLVGGGLG